MAASSGSMDRLWKQTMVSPIPTAAADVISCFFDDYIGRVAEHCKIDGILMHDDWGHQNGPFFSHRTAEDMLFPYLKRIVESCHKRGLFYEQHSCGRNETFMDLYVKAGVNLYCPQDINDFDDLLERAKGSQLMIGIPFPAFAMDADLVMVYDFPVTMKENMNATILRIEPVRMLTDVEMNMFCPEVIPDNGARGMVLEVVPYPREKFGGKDMFGVEWEYASRCTGLPGNGTQCDEIYFPGKRVLPSR